MITSQTPEWTLTPVVRIPKDEAFKAFIEGNGVFAGRDFMPLRRMFEKLDRITEMLAKEITVVLATCDLPLMKDVPLTGKASLAVLKHTFIVAAENRRFDESVHSFAQGSTTFAELESDCTSHIAHILPMGYIAQYALEGLASAFDAEQYAHEILATSAQRVKHLTDELTLSMNRGLLVAVLYGITNTEG